MFFDLISDLHIFLLEVFLLTDSSISAIEKFCYQSVFTTVKNLKNDVYICVKIHVKALLHNEIQANPNTLNSKPSVLALIVSVKKPVDSIVVLICYDRIHVYIFNASEDILLNLRVHFFKLGNEIFYLKSL